MSLRSKIVLILSVVVLLFAGIDQFIQRRLVFESFVSLEQEQATKDVRRVVQALESELRHLDRTCEDLAVNDDTWRYVPQPVKYKDFEFANCGSLAFHKNDINVLYICDTMGKVVWGEIRDLHSDRTIQLKDLPSQALSPGHPLLVDDADPEAPRHAGIWMTERGPLMVSSEAIFDSRHKGPWRGTLIMGRLLDEGTIADLRDRTSVEFHAWPVASQGIADEDREIIDQATASSAPVVRPIDDERLQAWTTFPDMRGAPALLIRADLSRDITLDGSRAVRFALISTVAAGLLIMIVLLTLLQRTVLKPLAVVTQHAVEIGASDETFRKLDLQRTDEIGILSREFDRMMEKLSQSRAALVQAARAAGMSEIATAVLHNVGNVLNSVNVSATLVAQKAHSSSANELRQALKAVEDSAGDLASFLATDPRGAHLQPLLVSLAEQMAVEQDTIREEVASLSRGIEHIQELVRSQQGYAGRAGVLEAVDVVEPIESALAMIGRPGTSSKPFEVVREFAELPLCAVDRHRLTEIVVNLLQNARQAMSEFPESRGRLTIRLRRPAPGRICIDVQDDGVGIPAENLDRIFTHGFTTKKSGHGFGLHSCANAAREMGGSLVAKSDGLGCGATFTLELPVREVPRPKTAGARS